MECQGFVVCSIPRGETQTADFLVTDSSYLVEVTGKEEAILSPQDVRPSERGWCGEHTRGLALSSRLDGIVYHEVRQLAEAPVDADSFSIVIRTPFSVFVRACAHVKLKQCLSLLCRSPAAARLRTR